MAKKAESLTQGHVNSILSQFMQIKKFQPESPLKKYLGTAALQGPISEGKLHTSCTSGFPAGFME